MVMVRMFLIRILINDDDDDDSVIIGIKRTK